MSNQYDSPLPSNPLDTNLSNLGRGDFRSSIMEAVMTAVPDTASKWEKADVAERKAIVAVTDGIRQACEISVALASNKAEAEKQIDEAERQILTGDHSSMGIYLQGRLEAIDSEIVSRERGGWSGTSTAARQFVEENLGSLCARLDAVSRDPALAEHCPDLRKDLFPKVVASEYKRDSARSPLSYVGPRGVSDLMVSEASKQSNDLALAAHLLGRASSEPATPLKLGSMIKGLRREDSPNVCQR